MFTIDNILQCILYQSIPARPLDGVAKMSDPQIASLLFAAPALIIGAVFVVGSYFVGEQQ